MIPFQAHYYDLARRIAIVPQDTHVDFAFTVSEILATGRYPHRGRCVSRGNRSLTPGASMAAALGDICAMDHEAVVLPVSDILRDQVFQEYGLRKTSADSYEVDFLISPGLGGTDDIHNLWPQPRFNATWNSFVKDQLEDYLHRSVCAGKVDLATAQRDVSTDWIAAYKKYFRTNEPVGLATSNSGHTSRDPKNSL